MTVLRYAQGHNNVANLDDLAHKPAIIKHLTFSPEYTANGVAKKIGGGEMHVRWSYLERSELEDLMEQFGITEDETSTEGTFLLPNWRGIHHVMNGQVTLEDPDEGNGYFTNIVAKFTGLAYT
jgi:hypothetical protein